MDIKDFDVVVVGAGFFGAVMAERIAADHGTAVLVIDKRNHIGGNSYSAINAATGIEYHAYGTHIFHTSNEDVWRYICRFTTFNEYRHRVLTTHRARVYSMPINLYTINQFYQRCFSPNEAQTFIASEIARDRIAQPKNLEEQAVSLIGRPLYEAFIKGYTGKQWETDPRELPANIITRLPVRFDYNDRYFADTHEGMPLDGYTKIFERMFAHPKIHYRVGVDYFDVRGSLKKNALVIYTGPIDRFFDYRYGGLGWRTVDLEAEVVAVGDFQGTSVMNYADAAQRFTRIHEFRHLHPERNYQKETSLIFREYSRSAQKSDEPYYPIATDQDKATYAKYQDEATRQQRVVFGGRLGTYRYFDMHQAIGAALVSYERDVRPKLRPL